MRVTFGSTAPVIDIATRERMDAARLNGAHGPQPSTPQEATAYGQPINEPRIGHNSGAAQIRPQGATVFEQFEAIVDSTGYTAEQKCILVKIRCRVNAKTMDNAIVSNEGLLRAASLKDPRALRAELRELQGKARELPEERDQQGRPVNDPVDDSRATIVIEARPGKASVAGFTPERLHAIMAAYLQHREQKRRAGRPPLPENPPASGSGGLSEKPPASGTGGLEKPPASHAENPLRPTHPDPFPLSGRKKENAASFEAAHATHPLDDPGKPPSDGARSKRKPKATEEQFTRFWAAYPKHDGKAKAMEKFLALSPEDAEQAITAAAAYATKCRAERIEAKFIKWAQGWLSDRRFEDDAPNAAHPQQSAEAALQQLAASGVGKAWLEKLGSEKGMAKLRNLIANARKGEA